MTVTSITCGKPLDQTVENYMASSDGMQPTTPAPQPGTEFCVVQATATNTGHAKSSFNFDNNTALYVGQDAYQQSRDDQMRALDYEQYFHSQGHDGPTFGANPHQSGPVTGVYEVPTGSAPSFLFVASGTSLEMFGGSTPGVRVNLS